MVNKIKLDTRAKLTLSLLLTTLAIPPTPAAAQPIQPAADGTGTKVTVNGNRFEIDGGTLSGDGRNLFHSFQEFGLDANQIANFLSNPQIRNILSRVNGGNPSIIDGLIQVSSGNSNLYLINPAGIIFGSNASLNLPADFTATTAEAIGFGDNWFQTFDENNYQQLTGNPDSFLFSGSGTIVNLGELDLSPGSSLTLTASRILNQGSLVAPGGDIIIAAVPGEQLVRISIPGNLLSLEIPLQMDEQGNVLPITAQTVLEGIKGSGWASLNESEAVKSATQSSGLPDESGSAIISGSLNTSGETVGNVLVAGAKIALDSASVDASGRFGGGNVFINGQEQIYLSRNSQINADAVLSGNGGEVIVYSNNLTRFYGEISATGGSRLGDGGFVEVSGKERLLFRGNVDVGAVSGQHGTILLDSRDINIVVDNGNNDDQVLDDGEILFSDGLDNEDFTITDTALTGLTGNITLEAARDITAAENANLIFANQTAGETITFTAGGNIGINTDIVTAGGAIRLTATGNITTADLSSSGLVGGNIELNATTGNINVGNINAIGNSGRGGNITIESRNYNVETVRFTNSFGDVIVVAENAIKSGEINAFSLSEDGGNVSIFTNNGNGSIEVEAINASGNSNFNGGDITINSGAAVRVTGTFTEEATGQEASISSVGGVGGAVSIEDKNSPSFMIGDPSLNGTAGLIVTADLTMGTGGTPDGIDNPDGGMDEPINETRELIDDIGQNDVIPPQNYRDIVVTNIPENVDSGITNNQIIEDVAVEKVEENATTTFEQYFRTSNISDTINTSQVTGQQAQKILSNIVANTNAKPALIYTSFSPGSNELKLVLVTNSGDAIQKQIPGATQKKVLQTAKELRKNIEDLRREREYLPKAQQLYNWLIKPLESELAQEKINNLVFIMESGLRSIPLAALHDGQQYLIENYSVGLMPSLSLTNTDYVKLEDLSVLAMGAETFADQIPLPGVGFELEVITEQLWPGESFLNQDFTVENLKKARSRRNYGIIHLATHAEFQRGKPANSYIQFNNEKLGLDRLRELGLSNPAVELMVLSACRTAVGDEEAELGFAGLAYQAGVKTVLGSLWYVSDSGTLVLMSEFYERLKTAPIKAEALRQAQLAMLRQEVKLEDDLLIIRGNNREVRSFNLPPELQNQSTDLSHPYYWSGFTMIGNPW